MFLPDGLSSTAASEPVVRVMLNEGTLIAARDETEDGAKADADSINVENGSTRYPLIVTATVSRAAVFAARSDLRMVGTIGAAALAVLIIALALVVPVAQPLQSDRRDGARAGGRASSSPTTSRWSICAPARSSAPKC